MYLKNDALEIALDWCAEKKAVALATVISTWGSAPCPVGSQLVVDDRGTFQGSVSGGCIESAVISETVYTIKHKKSQLLSFGVSSKQAWETGLACGGTIEIWLEPMTLHHDLWKKIRNTKSNGGKCCLLTNLETGEKHIFLSEKNNYDQFASLSSREEIVNSLKHDSSKVVVDGKIRYFLQSIIPKSQLVIVGAVHIAQPLSVLADVTGYAVIIIDPRAAFATKNRFPDSDLILAWPEEALEKITLHANTALVALSHTPRIDDTALQYALQSDAFYIGALGSRKTHANRQKRLLDAGFSLEQFGSEFSLIYVALEHTFASRLYILSYTAPFFAATGAHFFIRDDQITRWRAIGLIVAFVGVVILFAHDLKSMSLQTLPGDLMGLGAGAMWGGTTVYLKKNLAHRCLPLQTLFYQVFFSAPFLLALAFERPLITSFSVLSAFSLFFQCIVVAFLSYLVWFELIHRFSVSLLHAFSFFTPVFGVFLSGILILGEAISPRLIAALCLVSLGMILVNRIPRPLSGRPLR